MAADSVLLRAVAGVVTGGRPGWQPIASPQGHHLPLALRGGDAASKDLGLGNGAANGYLFWGLVKQAPREKDPVAALEHAWERYRERAEGIMAGDIKADTTHQLQDMLLKHSQEIAAIG